MSLINTKNINNQLTRDKENIPAYDVRNKK